MKRKHRRDSVPARVRNVFDELWVGRVNSYLAMDGKAIHPKLIRISPVLRPINVFLTEISNRRTTMRSRVGGTTECCHIVRITVD